MTASEAIRKYRIIAITRRIDPDSILATAEALLRGGLRLLEVTFDQNDPDTLAVTSGMISRIRHHFGSELSVGAGTVINEAQVAAAADAGAEYIVSPCFSEEVVRETLRRGLISIPGVMTPTEMAAAHRAGAQFVKLFPAGNLGIGYFKSVTSPLSHIPVIVTGGIDERNMLDFLSAGAVAVGLGSNVVNNRLISQGDYEAITKLALACTSKLAEAGI